MWLVTESNDIRSEHAGLYETEREARYQCEEMARRYGMAFTVFLAIATAKPGAAPVQWIDEKPRLRFRPDGTEIDYAHNPCKESPEEL